jgi:putative FmdB family regulatory protein
MPIYEYECGKCGVFEHSQRITEPALAKCPSCKRKVRRLISNTSFQLKGSGWYVTDYARSGSKDAKDAKGGEGKADTAAETKSDSGSAATTETKGAPKSDAKKKSDAKSGPSTASAA